MLIYFKYIISSKISKKSRGFTLTELIVVMAIATLLMTALIVRQGSWNEQLALNTQTYELALMIRQAQIYSLGVREYQGGTGDKFNISYGVSFDPDYTRYIFFADKNFNAKYDAGEEIETKSFARGVLIDRFCGVKGNGQLDDRCSPGQGNVAFLQILFTRPDPKANIILLNGGGQVANNVIPPGIIYLKSPGGLFTSVKVETNGQISIQ